MLRGIIKPLFFGWLEKICAAKTVACLVGVSGWPEPLMIRVAWLRDTIRVKLGRVFRQRPCHKVLDRIDG